MDTWLLPKEYQCRFQVGIFAEYYLLGSGDCVVSARKARDFEIYPDIYLLRFGVYAIALHGALTAGRPFRLRFGAVRVSARDPTAFQCSLS
eukprot:6214380-Pleurochrysis_carterae.AAC.2